MTNGLQKKQMKENQLNQEKTILHHIQRISNFEASC